MKRKSGTRDTPKELDALRQSEERYRKIFQHSNDATFVIDPAEDVILDTNPKACEMLGYSREKLLSLPISAIHPREMLQLQAFARSVLDKGHGWTNELSCLTQSGQFLPSEISASVMEDIEGRPYIIAMVRDITKRKRAEAALVDMASFAEKNPGPVLKLDQHGTILLVNPAARELLGEPDMLGKSWYALCPELEPIALAHEIEVGERCLLFTYRASQDRGQVYVYGADITERKEAEQTRQELAVTEERNRLAREIHDSLAQGLTGIIWQLNMAERTVKSGGEQASQALERVRNLAKEALQEARRSVWDLRAGPLEARTLAEALREETNKVAVDAGLRFSFDVSGEDKVLPAGIEASILRICQESLANVVKHAKATEVIVNLAYDDSKVKLMVQDNGTGFDPDAPKPRGKEVGGFGMISMRERARLLGGALTVRSKPGRGTIVEAALPTK